MANNTPRTLYEKIWDAHVVERRDDGTCLIYIDRHLVHEVTSPQAFESLRAAGRKVRRPDLTLAVPDHNLPTTARRDSAGNRLPIADAESAQQLAMLERNAPEFGIRYIGATDREQGIVHVVGPEQGFSLPGATIASRASSMSWGRNKAFPCPARQSSAATATLPAMADWARWRSGSAPARSSMCSPRRRCC